MRTQDEIRQDGDQRASVTSLLNGTIDTANNDDLRVQRDRLLELVQNVDLETEGYQSAVKMLTTTNEIIERLNNGESVGTISAVFEVAKNCISDPGFK